MIAASIPTPHVDWLALAPSLALLAASGVALLGSVLVPAWFRHAFSAVVAGAGFVTAGVFAGVVYDRSPQAAALISDSMTRDRWAALAQLIVAGTGVVAVLIAWGAKSAEATSASTTRSSPPPAAGWRSSCRRET